MANEEDIESYLDDEEREIVPENLSEDEIREIGTYTRGHVVKALLGSKKDKALSKRVLKLSAEDKKVMEHLESFLSASFRKESKAEFEKLKGKFGNNPRFLTLLKTLELNVSLSKFLFVVSLVDTYGDDFKLFEDVVNLVNREIECDVYFSDNHDRGKVEKYKSALSFIARTNYFSFDKEKQKRAKLVLENYPALYRNNSANLEQIFGAINLGNFYYSDSDRVNELLASEQVIGMVGSDVKKFQKILFLARKRGPLAVAFLCEMSEAIKVKEELFDLWINIIIGSAYSSNSLGEDSVNILRKIADDVNKDPKAYKVLDDTYHLYRGDKETTDFFHDLVQEDEEAAKILFKNKNSNYFDGDTEKYKAKNRFFFDLIKENYEAGAVVTKYLYGGSYELDEGSKELIKFYFDLAKEDPEITALLFEKLTGNFNYRDNRVRFKLMFDLIKSDRKTGEIFIKYWYLGGNEEGGIRKMFALIQEYGNTFEVYYKGMSEDDRWYNFKIEAETEYILSVIRQKPSIFPALRKRYLAIKGRASNIIEVSQINLLVRLIERAEGSVYMEYPGRVKDVEQELAKHLLDYIEKFPGDMYTIEKYEFDFLEDQQFSVYLYRAFEKSTDAGALVISYFKKLGKNSDFANFCFELVEEDEKAAAILRKNYACLDRSDKVFSRFVFDLVRQDYEAGSILAEHYSSGFEDREMIVFYFDLIKKDHETGKLLGRYVKMAGKNKEFCIYLWKLIKAGKEDMCKNLKKAEEFIDGDLAKAKVAEVYFEQIDVYDLKAINKFYSIYSEGGREKAIEFIAETKKRAGGLIGPEIPEELRKDDEYMLYVSHVFPEGNYSNYNTNLGCGDKVEHLAGYKYAKEGYPTQMSGLLGYKLIEGKEEDKELLESYNRRLGRIRDFVASRGPDNEALQKAFEEKVDGIFETEVREEFRAIEGLNIKEKMLILFLNVIVKRAKMEPYRYEIGDLIVQYKYAYHENLEAYIQRTADETARFKDPVSQNFNMWRELSVIYGENLKHVLRHDLFEEFEKNSKNKDEIEKVYEELMPSTEKFSVTEKQRGRFEATLNNDRIPTEKKLSVINGQALDIFSANVKFKNSDEKNKFIEQVNAIVSECSGAEGFDKEKFFDEAIPRLGRLRSRYMQNVNGKLEDLFSADINIINAEVSKFEEIVELEKKETSMGGEKHKEVEKSTKKRKIRSYIAKTKETANARMGAYVCIAGDTGMWKNPNYFELVMKDEETSKCVGVVMLLNIQASDGKKYLWFGPNPFEGFLGQVSSEQCYKYLYETVTKFADENNYDGVVVPSQDGQILGACTNRGGDFPDLIKASRLRDVKGALKVVEFGSAHTLGSSYSYSNGALIHEKKAA